MNLFYKTSAAAGSAFLAAALLVPAAAFAAGPAAVSLGDSGSFAVLAKTGVSTTGSTAVVGDVGVSPAAATFITGFALSLSAASAFATSPLVSGKIYAPGYADPTPANLTRAIGDMETAYTDAAGRSNPSATELSAGNIGGLTLAPGLYKWGTGVTIPSDVTLSGGAGDVWIFQIAGNLTVSSATKVLLSGGAQAGNIFWAVAGQTTLGTGSAFSGTILDQTAIVLNTGAQLNGRALAQSAVTLDANTVTRASSSGSFSSSPTPASSHTTSSNSSASNSMSTPVQNSSRGQAVTLGNGQVVYVSANGSFTNSAGDSVSISGTSAVPASSSYTLRIQDVGVNRYQGDAGPEVGALQQFLISHNGGPAARALAAVGATAYFGGLTRAALAEFQASAGISPALGNLGPLTRSYISAHY